MWRVSFEHGVGVKDPHPFADHVDFLLTKLAPTHDIRVAMDGQIVAFIAATPQSIAQLYVRVGFFGRGIGSALVDWAKRQSTGSLWLYTFERNARAQAFYERHGFRVVARGFEPFWQLADIKYEWVRES